MEVDSENPDDPEEVTSADEYTADSGPLDELPDLEDEVVPLPNSGPGSARVSTDSRTSDLQAEQVR